mmetsp:Transcript_22688/g.62641  ORF Transcript_22688/g.62641 Transcript_22688/m.62641 type:complete len:140 (+) Transcript_22688:634-1053(+)
MWPATTLISQETRGQQGQQQPLPQKPSNSSATSPTSSKPKHSSTPMWTHTHTRTRTHTNARRLCPLMHNGGMRRELQPITEASCALGLRAGKCESRVTHESLHLLSCLMADYAAHFSDMQHPNPHLSPVPKIQSLRLYM